MFLKIEPSGGTHAKDPSLRNNEIIICNNTHKKTSPKKATNKTCFFYCLKDARSKSFSLGSKCFLVDHLVHLHYLGIL
jgi:hypothetical protein